MAQYVLKLLLGISMIATVLIAAGAWFLSFSASSHTLGVITMLMGVVLAIFIVPVAISSPQHGGRAGPSPD